MSGHTPGPWGIKRNPVQWAVLDSRGYYIAENVRPQPGRDGDVEREANACLLAAAPDLLEALKLAQLWLANCVPTTDIEGPKPLPVIAAAIAKAEGQA